jgi:predicted nucleic acid-binding Zn ribbon protein
MEHISRSLDTLLKKLELDKKVLGWRVVTVWDEVVGPRIAANARPAAYRDSKLFVQVSTTTWLHELSYMKDEIVRRLNEKVGKKAIEDIVFSLVR